MRSFISVFFGVTLGSGLAAQGPAAPRSLADVMPHGAVVEHLTSRANPQATYAVYLPARYETEKKWPIVFLLDPRGRAMIPMELFRPVAERLGYILISSYDTQSDGARAPNDMAMDAMLDDVQRYLAIDSRRLYIAGFSGTARFAWDISEQMPGALAGIIGAGAGLPGDRAWMAAHVHGSPFGFFATVGYLDPNYEEVRQLNADLDATALPHQLARFDGEHQWPPAALCERALEWMELQAMRRGLRERDAAWIEAQGMAREREAASLDSAGRRVDALQRYRDYARDFAGVRETRRADSIVAALSRDRNVVRALQHEDDLARRDLEWARSLFGMLRDLKLATQPMSQDEARSRAKVDELRRLVAARDDSLGALAARRAINRVLVYTTFYELRDYFGMQRWDAALTILRVADAAAPGDPSVCFGLARVYAQLAKTREALDALECAAKGPGLTADVVEHAPLLAPIREEARYEAVVEMLRRKDAPGRS